jgi:hypothetical protein
VEEAAAIELALRLVGGAILTAALRTLLPGLHAVEPGVLAAVAAVLVWGASLACYLPLRRATRIAPRRRAPGRAGNRDGVFPNRGAVRSGRLRAELQECTQEARHSLEAVSQPPQRDKRSGEVQERSVH